jgi:hypothetical protein
VAHRLCDPVRDGPHGVGSGFRGTVGSLGSGTRRDVAELLGRLGDLVGYSLNLGTTAQLANPRLHALVRPSTSIRAKQETGYATKQQCNLFHGKEHLSFGLQSVVIAVGLPD